MKLQLQWGTHTTKFELRSTMLKFNLQWGGMGAVVEADSVTLLAFGSGVIGFIGLLMN